MLQETTNYECLSWCQRGPALNSCLAFHVLFVNACDTPQAFRLIIHTNAFCQVWVDSPKNISFLKKQMCENPLFSNLFGGNLIYSRGIRILHRKGGL